MNSCSSLAPKYQWPVPGRHAGTSPVRLTSTAMSLTFAMILHVRKSPPNELPPMRTSHRFWEAENSSGLNVAILLWLLPSGRSRSMRIIGASGLLMSVKFLDAIHNARRTPSGSAELIAWCEDRLREHSRYIVEHLEDLPEIRDWHLPRP
jgi:hypothetical protein